MAAASTWSVERVRADDQAEGGAAERIESHGTLPTLAPRVRVHASPVPSRVHEPQAFRGSSSSSSSGARERTFRWDGGWSVRCVHGHILTTEQMYAWKRELNLFEGQHIPEAVFGGNSLEIRHDASGVRLRFCALEALRAWASLDLDADNVRVARSHGVSVRYEIVGDYDFTYTSTHPGSTDVAPLGHGLPAAPDTGSPTPREAADLACGAAKLRKPLCKCKGYGGRVPLVPGSSYTRAPGVPQSTANVAGLNAGRLLSGAPKPPPRDLEAEDGMAASAVPPAWLPTEAVVDLKATMAEDSRPPLFFDNVDLYEDDMHECGMLMLRARVAVFENFIVAYQRYFLRVDGVRARVIDTRFVIRRGSPSVLRERSWREGSWRELVDSGDVHGRVGVSLEQINDSVAAERLPKIREPVVEALEVPMETASSPSAVADTALAPPSRATPRWTRETARCRAMCALSLGAGGGLVFVAKDGGRSVQCVSANDGREVWTREWGRGVDDGLVLALVSSPDDADGGRLALGLDCGRGEVVRAGTGEPLFGFVVSPRIAARTGSRKRSSTAGWVERLVWSADGRRIGAAAGRSVVIVSADDGSIVSSSESDAGTNTSIAFNNADGSLAVGTYGELRWEAPGAGGGCCADAPPPPLKRGASAVLCVAVSPDGTRVAMGCLDKTMRVYDMGGSESSAGTVTMDWVGFDAGVSCLSWSPDGDRLAAAGGTMLVVLRRGLRRGDPPVLCRTPGTPAADGAGSTCGRFDAIQWYPRGGGRFSNLIAGVESASGKVHIYDVDRVEYGFPLKCAPLRTLSFPAGSGPSSECHFSFLEPEEVEAPEGKMGCRVVLAGAQSTAVVVLNL